MMKIRIQNILFLLIGLLALTDVMAQDRPPHPELENPAIQGINKEYPRASFISYPDRKSTRLNSSHWE